MGTDVFVMSPLLPLIADHFHVSISSAGLGLTVFALSYAGLAPVFGHYGDSHGRRIPIVYGLITLGVSNAVTAWAPTFAVFLLARFIAGGAAAAITPSVYAATGDVAPAPRRGAWLAIVGSGVFTALWSSAPLGSLLGYRVGWPPVFLILAVVPLGLAAANFGVMSDAGHRPSSARGGYGRLIKDVSVTTLWGAALYGTFTYLGAALKIDGHCSPQQISLGIAAYGVGMVAGGISGGHLADRWGSRRVGAVSCVFLAVFVMIFRAMIGRLLPAMLSLFAFSYSAALFFPAYQTYLAVQHAERRGAALAWNNSALYVGVMVGSFLGGVIFGRVGFQGVPIMSGLFALLALVWGWRLQRPRAARAAK